MAVTPGQQPVSDAQVFLGIMPRIKSRVASMKGLTRFFLAFGLGCLATAGLPPLYVIPVLLPSFIGLYWLTQSARRPRAALAAGWAFGFGFFLVGFYWIGNAFMVYAARHAWMAIPAVVGLAGAFGLYVALTCWLHRHLFRQDRAGLGGVMVFAAFWVGAEWLRAWLFTGFPWNLIGSIWAFSDAMIQPAAFVGTYGLSLLTVMIFCCPAMLGESDSSMKSLFRNPLILSLGIILIMWSAGTVRLAGAVTEHVPDITLRLVQPNIPQAQKWQRDLKGGHVLKQLDMSLNSTADKTGSAGEAPSHVIWAETAVPFVLSQDPALVNLLGQAAPEHGALITGALRSEPAPGNADKLNFSNSLFAISSAGDIVSTYDKTHLVPFGEYVPLRDFLPIEKLTAGAGQFTPGDNREPLSIAGLPPFSPLICYEIIFPGDVVANGARPEWLLNLTNDAWYGLSAGPYQHYVSSRLRAVEEGLPVVRVANTGISGVIDGYGRTEISLGLGMAGVLDVALPKALPPSFYGRHHNSAPVLITLFVFVAGMVKYWRDRHAGKN